MTEHRPIKPPRDEDKRGDERPDRSSLLERASGAFGLNDLGAAPMPRSFDDVPMKRARPLRREQRQPDSAHAPSAAPAPAPAPVPTEVEPAHSEIEPPVESALPVAAQPSAPPPAVIEGRANPIALSGESVEVDFNNLRERGFIDPHGQASALAEEFRIVKRQVLETARLGGSALSRRVLVTSPHENEGKTFCAVNLALSLAAERDLEVVLIDADIANPSVKAVFGLPDRPGLMDVLADAESRVEAHVLKTDIAGLWLLPPGRQASHASEALSSRRTAEIFERLTAQAPNRIVLVDSPPALAASPAAEIAKHVGQTILIARADRTAKSALEDAAQLLGACPDIKLVLNGANFSPSGRRFGSYYG
ncbi:P-loop NTPase family protein [Alteriqipengyuania lutimaris]|uniref:Capsular biosynthesis protein n=1 Tax=Alteriqipengyuania lutimaris TaxID=1538146 RepID=A0A395LMN1_9SPHN|nr:capsular biosynthesis protein [Alteriqipengyuania lutimaris]MBB3032754.1 Mrp family chromosome partitioning ATPase [Alteriqipengyuania lutimaris]RDS78141.1 capsular biosynthesis protein [Alteriqipengyuania lutimaris]